MRTTYPDSTEIGSKRGPGQTTAAPGGTVTGLAKQRTPHATSVEGPGGLCGPASHKSHMQFDWEQIQQSLKTLQFQRCGFMV